jgi:anaerobic magnesium-protoporphyrin IX monomethyl ester cyclase
MNEPMYSYIKKQCEEKRVLKIVFVEPPKDYWFVMGEYLPPPFGLIQLATYVEREVPDVEIEIVDCNAEEIDWNGLEKRLETLSPDMVGVSSVATCNAYVTIRAAQTAKKVNPDIITVSGGQHFTALAQESLSVYPELDLIIRDEGEKTLTELIRNSGKANESIQGLSFRNGKTIVNTPNRPLIKDLNDLPYPGYHFVENHLNNYYFTAMGGRDAPYALIEGGRGCPHKCTFCTQWSHWGGYCRTKTPERIADEIAYCYNEYGSRFIWLTDDNFGVDRASGLTKELLKHRLGDDLELFLQLRCDDVIKIQDELPTLHRAGLEWVMMGVESPWDSTLKSFKKGIDADDSRKAVDLLKDNGIFAHAMFVIGERKDTLESISYLREFANEIDPDFVIFTVLTPFPGTSIYDEALVNGWIEDTNWANYDMAHAIMSTEALSRLEVQKELWECYRSFYGSWGRRFSGIFSRNSVKRRISWYMLGQGIVGQFKALF